MVGRQRLRRGSTAASEANANAAVERVDAGADLGRLLADGGGREPRPRAAVPVALGVIGHRRAVELVGEVEPRGAAAEVEHGRVVGARGGDGGGVGTQPDPRPLVRLADLRHPLAPLAHPNAAILPPSSSSSSTSAAASAVPCRRRNRSTTGAQHRRGRHRNRGSRRGLRRRAEGSGVPLHPPGWFGSSSLLPLRRGWWWWSWGYWSACVSDPSPLSFSCAYERWGL